MREVKVSSEMRLRAESLGAKIRAENGVMNLVQHVLNTLRCFSYDEEGCYIIPVPLLSQG